MNNLKLENYYFILDENKNVIPADMKTFEEWCYPFEEERRRVALTEINDYTVSNVFLGINHALPGSSKVIVFETMVFDENGDDVYMTRYDSWNEAEMGHMAAVNWVKNGACEV